MKMTIAGLVLALGVSCILVRSAVAGKKSGEVYFEPNAAVLYGVNVSEDDQKALNDILKQFDKSLYKLKTYENSKWSTRGTLDEMLIDKKVAKLVDKNQPPGWCIQIGKDIHEALSPTPRAQKDDGKSQELVRRVTSILKKYSKG